MKKLNYKYDKCPNCKSKDVIYKETGVQSGRQVVCLNCGLNIWEFVMSKAVVKVWRTRWIKDDFKSIKKIESEMTKKKNEK